MMYRVLFLILILVLGCKKEEAAAPNVCEDSFKGKDPTATSQCVQGEWDVTAVEGAGLPGPTPLTNTYIRITATDSIYYWKKGALTAADKIAWVSETNLNNESYSVMKFEDNSATTYSWRIDGIYSGQLKVIDDSQGLTYTMEEKD